MERRLITVLDPTATPRPVRRDLAERRTDLAGRTVAFVSNSKPNVDVFFGALEPALGQRLEGVRVLRETKPTASIPLATDRLDAIARGCAGAVVAICD